MFKDVVARFLQFEIRFLWRQIAGDNVSERMHQSQGAELISDIADTLTCELMTQSMG